MNYGRPLRFLAILLLSWVCGRMYFISPFAGEEGGDAPTLIAERMPDPIRVERPGAARAPPPPPAAAPSAAMREPTRDYGAGVAPARQPRRAARRAGTQIAARAPSRPFTTPLRMPAPAWPAPAYKAEQFPEQAAATSSPPATAVPDTPALLARADSPRVRRLTGYAWAFAREGGGEATLAGNFSQLGGSQAGLRLDYALGRDPSHGLALTGRVSAPLATRFGREAALGLKYKPSRTSPVSFIAERRISLGRGGRDAFAAMAVGGVGPFALPAGFRLEAYGQAGVVGLKSTDFFADGQVTALRTVVDTGRATLSIGAGAWGGAQPGASRLDIGPRARVGFPLPDGRGIGVSVDYRRRVAGDARPGSGVAITLDTSF